MLNWTKLKPPSPSATAEKEKLTLQRVQEKVTHLHDELPRHKQDLEAVQDWLNNTRGQLDQVRNRLSKLSNWINRYNVATEVARECLRLRGSLWTLSPSKVGQDWETLARQIDSLLSPIKLNHEGCRATIEADISKETGVFKSRDFAILHDCGRCTEEINHIETSLAVLRMDGQEEAKYKDAFRQIQDNAKELAEGSVHLCQELYADISALVKELEKPIREL